MTSLYIDAPSLVYRAFFALPKTITDDKGRSVNAVRGFMDMLTWMMNERHPDEMLCVFDADWRPQFRVDVYPGYKAERPDDPEELPWQFILLTDVLDAAGIPRAESAGLEADDAIATLIAGVRDDEEAFVVSGDRDLLCLVRDPNVKVLFPVRGVREMTVFDEAGVEEKYGISPRLYPDFAMLRGDSSDGLPGVPGIGPVRAAKLLKEHGSLDEMLADLESLPKKTREVIEGSVDYLRAAQKVVTLVTDAPIERTERKAPDVARVRELGEAHNLGSSAGRLLRALEGLGDRDR